MALKLYTAPASEPVTLQEAKDHLRIDTDDEDGYIESLITAARQDCEDFHRRAYFTQTWELWLDAFPAADFIKIPLPPLASVSSIKYYDTSDTEATFSSTYYFVDVKSEPGRVSLDYGQSWPSTTLRPINGVCVTFVAGHSTVAAIPKLWKQAILLLVGHLYEHRETVIVGTTAVALPHAVEALLWKDRVF